MRFSGNNKDRKLPYFEDGHLDDAGQALASDALALSRVDDLPGEIQDHLGECQECRELVLEIYHIQEKSGMLPSQGTHPFFNKYKIDRQAYWSRLPRSLKYAAIIILVAVSSFLIYNTSTALQDSAFSHWVSDLFSTGSIDPYAEDPMMESLLGMAFREDSFSVIQPAIGDTILVGASIQLVYEGKLHEQIRVEFLNNQGECVHTQDISGGSSLIRPRLKPGLYYWKLTRGQALFHIGKLLVREEE